MDNSVILVVDQERLREVLDSQRPNPIPELIGKLSAHLEKVFRGREKLDRILRDLKEMGTGGAA